MTLAVGGALSALTAFQTQPPATPDASQSAQTQAQASQATAAAAEAATISILAGASATSSTGASTSAGADALGQAASVADTAQAAAGTVVQLLQQLQQAASAASDPGLSSAARASLNTDFQALAASLNQTVNGASASGVNLVDGSSSPGVQVAADADGGRTSLSAYNLSLGGPIVTVPTDASIATASAATAVLAEVTSSLQSTGNVLDTLSSQAKQIGAHADFVSKLGASLSAGAGGTDSADGVRLQALQLQQLLSGQTSGIANTGPQAVLSLFRTS